MKKKNRLCWSFLCLASLLQIKDYVVRTGHRMAVVRAPFLHTVNYIVGAFPGYLSLFVFSGEDRRGKIVNEGRQAGSRVFRGSQWAVPLVARYQPSSIPQGPLFCGMWISRPKPAPHQALTSPCPRSSTSIAISICVASFMFFLDMTRFN